jgi:hypothetical protein
MARRVGDILIVEIRFKNEKEDVVGVRLRTLIPDYPTQQVVTFVS